MKHTNNALKYWRDSYNYREGYFKKNHGLFRCIWFCSQCGKPLLSKRKVQVDHIIPPSVFAYKKYRNAKLVSNTSILAKALNSSFNTVAICPECNLKKSDKMGMFTAKGVIAKTGETTLASAQRAIGLITYGTIKTIWLVGKLLLSPFKTGSPFLVKLILGILYFLVILYLLP